MTDIISTLIEVNPLVEHSDIADFQFKTPKEAIIFAHWTGAILPFGTDAGKWFQLPADRGANLNPLFAPDITAMFDERWLTSRKYVFVRRLVNPRSPGLDYNYFSYFAKTMGEVVSKGIRPEEAIIWPQHDYQLKGANDEAFWEYLAGCYFRDKGFLVTRWCPTGVPGDPDLCAYRLPKVNTSLRQAGLMGKGSFLFELDLWRVFGKQIRSMVIGEQPTTVVVEAKAQSSKFSQAIRQLTERGSYAAPKPGYLSEGHFDEGYAVGPGGYPREREQVGLISNTDDYHVHVSPCKRSFAREERKRETLEELERFLKRFLCRGLEVKRLDAWLSHINLSKCSMRDLPIALSEGLETVSLGDICREVVGRE